MPADVPSHNWRRADLKAAEHAIRADTLSHTRFESTQLELQDAIECSSMVMLLGSTGVGKTRLIETLVRESNALVCDVPAQPCGDCSQGAFSTCPSLFVEVPLDARAGRSLPIRCQSLRWTAERRLSLCRVAAPRLYVIPLKKPCVVR